MKTLLLIAFVAMSVFSQVPTHGTFSIDPAVASRGGTAVAHVRFDDPTPDQEAFTFTIDYDANVLSNLRVFAGPDVPADTSVMCNPNRPGHVGVLIDSSNIFTVRNADVMEVVFDVSPTVLFRRSTALNFACWPLLCSASDQVGNLEANLYSGGVITLTK